jgi:predicted transcriptional regulator
MHKNKYAMRKLGIILFFLIIICIPVYAQVAASPVYEQKGGYTVKPYEPPQSQAEQNLTYTKGAINTISFWDLPQWIQVTCAIEALIALFVFIKFMPVLIGKLSTLYKNHRAKKVLKYVTDYPGSTITQISKETNINRDTVKYYIYQFVSRSEIVLERIGRYSLLYRAPVKSDEFEKKVVSYLHNKMSSKMLWAIIKTPGITNVELSEKFGLTRSTIHWYTKRFQMDKMVTCHKQGNFKKYYINDKTEIIIREYYKCKIYK